MKVEMGVETKAELGMQVNHFYVLKSQAPLP